VQKDGRGSRLDVPASFPAQAEALGEFFFFHSLDVLRGTVLACPSRLEPHPEQTVDGYVSVELSAFRNSGLGRHWLEREHSLDPVVNNLFVQSIDGLKHVHETYKQPAQVMLSGDRDVGLDLFGIPSKETILVTALFPLLRIPIQGSVELHHGKFELRDTPFLADFEGKTWLMGSVSLSQVPPRAENATILWTATSVSALEIANKLRHLQQTLHQGVAKAQIRWIE
jgi:hypothetical protein